MATLQAQINALKVTVDALKATIGNLGVFGSIVQNVQTLQTQAVQFDQNIGDLQLQIYPLEAATADHEARITALESGAPGS